MQNAEVGMQKSERSDPNSEFRSPKSEMLPASRGVEPRGEMLALQHSDTPVFHHFLWALTLPARLYSSP